MRCRRRPPRSSGAEQAERVEVRLLGWAASWASCTRSRRPRPTFPLAFHIAPADPAIAGGAVRESASALRGSTALLGDDSGGRDVAATVPTLPVPDSTNHRFPSKPSTIADGAAFVGVARDRGCRSARSAPRERRPDEQRCAGDQRRRAILTGGHLTLRPAPPRRPRRRRPGCSWRPRRVSATPLTSTPLRPAAACSSPPDWAKPASFSSWPRPDFVSPLEIAIFADTAIPDLDARAASVTAQRARWCVRQTQRS